MDSKIENLNNETGNKIFSFERKSNSIQSSIHAISTDQEIKNHPSLFSIPTEKVIDLSDVILQEDSGYSEQNQIELTKPVNQFSYFWTSLSASTFLLGTSLIVVGALGCAGTVGMGLPAGIGLICAGLLLWGISIAIERFLGNISPTIDINPKNTELASTITFSK
jgi:hypothetical protein